MEYGYMEYSMENTIISVGVELYSAVISCVMRLNLF